VRCTGCGFDNPDGLRFCGGCGNALTAACPGCGFANPPGFRFCGECGAALGATPQQVTEKERPLRDASAYTPKHLADKILASRSALEGERKQVTVLFADVKGSLELAESLDPEAWHRILDRFFQVLADGIHRFEGTVNQFTGDGVMALFGAPIAHEDHPQRACFAALHLRDAVREVANEVRVRHGVPFAVRIGLNSGEVVVGKIGDDLRMDYTAQGHTVGLAQRMEALAEPGHIALSEHTARLVEGFFQLHDLGRIRVKGASEPVGMFDLAGVGRFRTRLDRSRARGLSAFVGREREMAFLEAALERSRGGAGQIVGVVAEAGTGKSRLCTEFLDTCRARGIPVVEGRGVSHGQAIPMLPMLEMWRAYYGISESDRPEAVRAKIAGRLLLMDESYRESLPLLFDLFGVPDPANPSPPLDAEQRQRRLHALARRALHDPADTGTLVTLLEDLHWFDGASDAFLETMVESHPGTRNVLLLNFRPEYQARWMGRSYYQQLPLQPLGPEAIRALLDGQLGGDPSVAGLRDLVHERTRGNPFFIEELLQSLVEKGQLTGARGAFRLTAPLEALEVPASVQALLAARIDRLREREKQLLQTAAVIGGTFSEALLRRVTASVAPLSEAELTASLSALASAEFVFETSLYPQLEYSFKHPLTQEVALRSQLRERRMRVHAAVADALEAGGGSLDERAAEIARHWDEAEHRDRAARWHRRAAVWAGLSDPREALRHWRRVRELAPGLADERERSALGLAACHQLLALGWRMGGSEAEAREVFEEGRALAEQSGEHRELALLVGRYGQVCTNQGSATDGVRYGEEAVRLAETCGDPALLAALRSILCFAYMTAGDCRRLLDTADRVLALDASDNARGKEIIGHSPRVAALQSRYHALWLLGRLEEATAPFREAERAAEEAHELEALTWLLPNWGEHVLARGTSEPVLERARRGFEIAEKLDNEASRIIACVGLGIAHLVEGRPTAARDALLESAALSRERRTMPTYLGRMLALLAHAQLALGERGEALVAAREAIALTNASGCQWFEAEAQLALAQALLAAEGAPSRAEIEAALARAEALVESTGARVCTPRVLELRGRLAAAVGDAEAADHALRRALALDREIGASGHAERLARELAPRK
jgi:class 3 adenylate cyclase/tetratricopeptide (TPR) repeat protein